MTIHKSKTVTRTNKQEARTGFTVPPGCGRVDPEDDKRVPLVPDDLGDPDTVNEQGDKRPLSDPPTAESAPLSSSKTCVAPARREPSQEVRCLRMKRPITDSASIGGGGLTATTDTNTYVMQMQYQNQITV